MFFILLERYVSIHLFVLCAPDLQIVDLAYGFSDERHADMLTRRAEPEAAAAVGTTAAAQAQEVGVSVFDKSSFRAFGEDFLLQVRV